MGFFIREIFIVTATGILIGVHRTNPAHRGRVFKMDT